MPSETVSKEVIHEEFLSALESAVQNDPDTQDFPLEVELNHPLPQKIRIYAYNVTSPAGDRPSDEYKAQLIAPGQQSRERGSFEFSEDWFVLLLGYVPDEDVFVLWDAYLHPEFAFSTTVQVKQDTIDTAIHGGIGEQLRSVEKGEEVVITSNYDNLKDCILKRVKSSKQTTPDEIPAPSILKQDPERSAVDYESPEETTTKVTRRIRNTEISNELKQLYEYRCQVCDERRQQSEDDYYAEAHHIKPLKDGGPDDAANIIILCPNHHADFDFGLVKVEPSNLKITHAYEDDSDRYLSINPGHELDDNFIAYNNEEVAEF